MLTVPSCISYGLAGCPPQEGPIKSAGNPIIVLMNFGYICFQHVRLHFAIQVAIHSVLKRETERVSPTYYAFTGVYVTLFYPMVPRTSMLDGYLFPTISSHAFPLAACRDCLVCCLFCSDVCAVHPYSRHQWATTPLKWPDLHLSLL